MFDSKFYTTLVSLAVAVIVICNLNPNKKQEIEEGFLTGASLTQKVMTDTHVLPKGDKANDLSFTNSIKNGGIIKDFGHQQALLSPRAADLQTGALLNHHMAGQGCNYQSHCGSNSLTSQENFTDMVRENFGEPIKEDYCANCNSQGCACREKVEPYMAGNVMKPDYAFGDYNQVVGEDRYPDVSNDLPVSGMDSINALGEQVQVVQTNRLVHANRNSRLRSLGDPIRGDLAITPCQSDWFRPSVQPNIDLQQGALSVMAGYHNEQGKSLAALINSTTKGTDSTMQGINMATQKDVSNSMSYADLNVSSFL
jgi:hypothetical protein